MNLQKLIVIMAFDQVLSFNSVALYDTFNAVFAFLPLAAIVNERTFLVHGGISYFLRDVHRIAELPKKGVWEGPGEESQMVQDMMWSDPMYDIYGWGMTMRGRGHAFGEDVLKEFLKANNLDRVIRSHQCVEFGIESFSQDRLITVFSTSNYTTDVHNCAAILKINNNGSVEAFNFQPINTLTYKASNIKQFGAPPVYKKRVRLQLRKYSSIASLTPKEFKSATKWHIGSQSATIISKSNPLLP